MTLPDEPPLARPVVRPPPLPLTRSTEGLQYETQYALPPVRYRSLVMALSLAVLSCPAVSWMLWEVVSPVYPIPFDYVGGWVGFGSMVGLCAGATAAGHLRGQSERSLAWAALLLCFVWMFCGMIMLNMFKK